MRAKTGKPAQHPGHHWGPFAADPASDLLDLVTGEAWNQAVASAKRLRLATQSAEERRRAAPKRAAE